MPVASLPSWLQADDPLAAIRAGAEAGLGRARITQAADEAAARLGLGYAELGSRERMQSAENTDRRETAAEALRARENEAMARLGEIKAQHAAQRGDRAEASRQFNAAQALRERHQNYLERKAVKPEGGATGGLDLSKIRVTKRFPEVPASEGTPGTPAWQREIPILGIKVGKLHPAVPSVPATQYQPATTVTRPPTPDDLRSMGYTDEQISSTMPQPSATPAVNTLTQQSQRNPLPYIGANVTSDKSSKAAAANKLAAENPDWTREQVLEAVKRLSTP